MSGHALAESFDREAAHYERGRPSWPLDVLDVLPLEGCGTVVDLGAGTGKLTRLLVRQFERVIAVEPLEGMRALLSGLVPEAQALAGSAEEIPLGDGTIDAVFCAERRAPRHRTPPPNDEEALQVSNQQHPDDIRRG
jgi:SAM-dependent methyltransferase